MGDQIYPGFQLMKVEPTVTEAMIEEFLGENFTGVEYRKGKPEIRILQIVGTPANNAFISGMKLPWREIRQRLGMRKLGKWMVRWRDCVFDLPRKEDGLLSFENEQLQKHLMEGLGRTPIMNLFSDKFLEEQLGGLTEMSYSIKFQGIVRDGKTKMLETAGKVLQYRKSPMYSPRKYLEAEFLFRLEAVQAICLLNRNSKFSSNSGTFETTSVCTVTQNCGLGNGGQVIDIKKYVDELGYVPFKAFNSDILNKKYITSKTPRCWYCSKNYRVLGWDADMHFVAAVCDGCNPLQSPFAWKGEDFFRLVFNPYLHYKINKFQTNAQHRGEKYILQTQGLQPLYDNLAHFERSALAAERMEFENHRRNVGLLHQVKGEIMSLDKIETTIVNGKQHEFWRVQLETKRTELWRPEGVFGISRCNLIPSVKSDNNVVDDTAGARLYRFHNKQMPGRLFKIKDQLDGNVVITLVVSLPKGIVLKPKKSMWIVPRPSSIEQTALKKSMSKWRTFMMERLAGQTEKVPVTVTNAKHLQTLEWLNDDCCIDFWELQLDLGKLEYWKKATSRMEDDYLAGDVELKVNNRASMEEESYSTVARIVDVNFNEDKWTARVIVNVRSSQTIVANQDCRLAMWRAIIFDRERLSDEYPQHEGLVEMDSDDEISDFRSIEELLAVQKTGIESIQDVLQPIYEDSYVVNRYFGSEKPCCLNIFMIAQYWMERPKNFELTLLDFLLHKSHPTINHKANVTGRPRLPCFPHYMQALKAIQDRLNPSQYEAVKTVYKTRLSVIHGPPGTGKTRACIDSALHLLCLENGMVVLTAPSNYAADHLYKSILNMIEELGLCFRVIRMLSMKRELVDLDRQEQGTVVADHRLLHNAVRNHPLWTKDLQMQNILESDESRLTFDERKAKFLYIRRIEHDILRSTQIIVATVGSAGDTRLESIAKEFKDSPRKFSAIIVDEASLLSASGLVPLMTLQPIRIVLAGDDAQLSKVVANETALNAGLDISWMTFIRMTPYAQENKVITLLDIQYRMCQQIATILSKFAYDGKVNSDTSVIERNYEEDKRFLGLREKFPELAGSHMAIYTYAETDAETAGIALSFYNQKEIDITFHLARKLLKSGIKLDDIVVLSMYDNHAKILAHAARKTEDLRLLDVCTSDSFQGRETSIVILNMVRSNAKHNIGFLRNKKRLVVGISRALDYLLFVGDVKTIHGSKIPDIVALIDNMKESGAKVIDL